MAPGWHLYVSRCGYYQQLPSLLHLGRQRAIRQPAAGHQARGETRDARHRNDQARVRWAVRRDLTELVSFGADMSARRRPGPGCPEASPGAQAEEAIEDAADKVARRGRGQGFQLDQEAKVAVEAHAMNKATELYARD